MAVELNEGKHMSKIYIFLLFGFSAIACDEHTTMAAFKTVVVSRSQIGGAETPDIELVKKEKTRCEYKVSVGTKPTGGYSIENVRLENGQLFVELNQPQANRPMIQMLTAPMAIVQISPCPKETELKMSFIPIQSKN